MVARSLPDILPAPMVADDLAEMPNDGMRYELVDGDLIVNDAPIPNHQTASAWLLIAIVQASEFGALGDFFTAPINVRFSATTQVEPDLVYVRRERQAIIGDKRIEGEPDLIMEILSPSTRTNDTVRKANLYAANGVPEYWIVDIDRNTIEAFQLTAGRYERIAHEPVGPLRSLVLPNLTINPSAFFAKLR